MRRLFFIFLILVSSSAHAASGKVIATVKPLHSLVAGVMKGSNIEPALLVDGSTSLHDFSLKPSQAGMIRSADIIFYMGEGFEQFLVSILPDLPASTMRVPMVKAQGMTLYKKRGKVSKEEESGVYDMHAWMAPQNAKAMVKKIARMLSITYPEHAALFAANAKVLNAKIEELDKDIAGDLEDVKGAPFAAFHDAYQYLEKSYDLTYIGSITLSPEIAPSAKHVKQLREKIKSMKARCIFREPEFDGRIVDALVKDTGAESAVLDPEGTQLTPGPDLYFKLMEGVASTMESCLD